MRNRRTLVIIDTNKLGKYKSGSFWFQQFNFLDTNKDLLNIIIRPFREDPNVTIAIPSLVFDELISEQILSFKSEEERLKNKFQKFKGIPGYQLKIGKIDYKKYLTSLKDSFIVEYNITEIPIPSTISLHDVIHKSLRKYPPFGKKKGDAGLKDEVIWQSIIEFVKQNRYDYYMLLTGDSDFDNEQLLNEFKEVTGSKIDIVKDIGILKSMLDEIINTNKTLINIVKKIQRKKDEILDTLNDLPSTIDQDSQSFDIIEWKDFEIMDIKRESENSFEIIFEFEIVNETPYTGFGIVDPIYQPYEEEVNLVKVTMRLKNNRIVEIKSDDILFYGSNSIKLSKSRSIDLR